MPDNVQNTLAHLKMDDMEMRGKEADHVLALPRKAQAAIFSAQQPYADSGVGSDDEYNSP